MKTKTHNDIHAFQTGVSYRINPATGLRDFEGPSLAVSYDRAYGRITNTTLKWPRFNACVHEQSSIWINPSSYTGTHADVVYGDRIWHWPAYYTSWFYYVNVDAEAELPAVDFDSAVGKAWESMRPTMDSKFSLPNFLWEAKQLKGLAGIYRSSTSALSALLSLISEGVLGRAVRHRRKVRPSRHTVLNSLGALKRRARLAKRAVAESGDTLLNFKFGWVPLYSDIVEVIRVLRTTKARLMKLRANATRKRIQHYRRYIPHDSVLEIVPNPGDDAVTELTGETTFESSVFAATATFTYKLPQLDDLILQCQGWLDAFGVNADPQIIWDAIPYSFVIDWMSNVGDWLGSFKTSNVTVHIELIDFCASLKQKSYYRLFPTGESGSNWNFSLNGDTFATRSHTVYTRAVVNPTLHVAPSIQALNGMQVLLGSALLNQRLK